MYTVARLVTTGDPGALRPAGANLLDRPAGDGEHRPSPKAPRTTGSIHPPPESVAWAPIVSHAGKVHTPRSLAITTCSRSGAKSTSPSSEP